MAEPPEAFDRKLNCMKALSDLLTPRGIETVNESMYLINSVDVHHDERAIVT